MQKSYSLLEEQILKSGYTKTEPMKRLLLVQCLLLWSGMASAGQVESVAFLPHGGGAACPPSVNGATIFPNTRCFLTDNASIVWTYSGGTTLFANGAPRSTQAGFALGNCGGSCASLSDFNRLAIG